MANSAILDAVAAAWSKHGGNGKKMLDLSCGDGETAFVGALGLPRHRDGLCAAAPAHSRDRPSSETGRKSIDQHAKHLNVVSRLRFLFTGFLRGRVRPAHYTGKPGQAPNIYLMHFYELYYLLFHYGLEIEKLRRTRVKFAARLFTYLFWPFMWLSSLIAIIGAEKDRVQRGYNWQILAHLFDPALLMSDNIV